MKNTKIKFEVIENNGGLVSLVVFGVDGKIEYVHTGYEYAEQFTPSQFAADLEALRDGAPVSDWDGNEDDPQGWYDDLLSFSRGRDWEVVADNDGLYPDKMGNNSAELFGVDNYGFGCGYSFRCWPITKKSSFELMVDDFMADHPEHSDLLIGEAEKDESGNWVAYAEDDRSTYILHDCGGNILLDYIGTK